MCSFFIMYKPLFFLKYSRVLGITVSWLYMQNAFSLKGVSNIFPGLHHLLLCLHPYLSPCLAQQSVLGIYRSLQRTKDCKAFAPRCLLSVEAFAQVLDKLLLVVFERAAAMGLFPQRLLIYLSWVAAIADIFWLYLTHSR